MKHVAKYLVACYLIISCSFNPISGRQRSAGAARGLSLNKGNSGQMIVSSEDILPDSDTEHQNDLKNAESHTKTASEPKFESTSESPITITSTNSPVEPITAISNRIYDILAGVGVLLTMLMYQIASYYWTSFTNTFRFGRDINEVHPQETMNLAGLVTSAIENISKKFGSTSKTN